MTGAVSIARLRAIAARLVEHGDADAEWFATALAEFEAGAPLGVCMEHAFSLACSNPGERPWWAIEAQQRRDDLFRAIDAQRFAHLPARAAARDMWTEIRRYDASAWRRDRVYMSAPSGPHADLFRLLRLGAPLSEGTIRRALAGARIPLLVSHALPEDDVIDNRERHVSTRKNCETSERPCANRPAAA